MKTTIPKIYSRYDVPVSPVVLCEEPSMTQQCFAQDADINNIMARYEQTGTYYEDVKGSRVQPVFGDYSTPFDFQDALNTVIDSEELFENLPAKVRRRFDDDPYKMLAFVSDDENFDECVRLGLFDDPSSLSPKGAPESPHPLDEDDAGAKQA